MAPVDSRPPGYTARKWAKKGALSSGLARVHRTAIKRAEAHDPSKIAGAPLLFPIAKAGRFWAFGAADLLGFGRRGLGRRRRLLLVVFDLGFILNDNWS